MIREILISEKEAYNQTVSHLMQSVEWGEFREKTGVKVWRLGKFVNGNLISGMQGTFHQIPGTDFTAGYVPKGNLLDRDWLQAWAEVGARERAVFIKFEPNVLAADGLDVIESLEKLPNLKFRPAQKPLFTKYNFLIDLSLSDDELLAKMKPKTRYNIRLAQRKGLVVEEQSDPQAFATYLKLYFETTKRQKFFGHNPAYHQTLWETLRPHNLAHLLLAFWQGSPLVAWMLFNFKETLYYAYGGSTTTHRELMPSNLVGWEAVCLGKKLGCQTFDLWGAARVPDPEPNDPFYGFHRFKAGFGGQLVEYVGSFDLILKPLHYQTGHFLDWLRWRWLEVKSKLAII